MWPNSNCGTKSTVAERPRRCRPATGVAIGATEHCAQGCARTIEEGGAAGAELAARSPGHALCQRPHVASHRVGLGALRTHAVAAMRRLRIAGCGWPR